MSSLPWILAIDFGTSYTVAVARVEGRSPEVLEIGGERRVPSVILAEDGERIVVGRIAEELSGTNPGSTLRAPKSRLGDQSPVVLDGRPYQVVQLVAALLGDIYGEAVRQMGSAPTEVRLTHPATWNRPWLNRLLEAAAKAGLPSTVLVPEPVAAALSYAAEVGVAPGAHIVVYDLGGGTFDTAVVAATDTSFTVVGRPGGDPSIGGELFDEILVNELGARLDPAAWESIQVGSDPTWQRVGATLRNEARRAKETLSSHPYADVLLPLPAGLAQLRVTRQEYESLVAPYIEETVTLLGRCIANAGLDPKDLAAIYLVGGASRTPLVEQLTSDAYPGVAVSRRGDPKTAVAMGAVRAVHGPDTGIAGVGPRSTEDEAAATSPQPLLLGTPPGVASDPGFAPPGTLPPPPTAPPTSVPPAPAPPPSAAPTNVPPVAPPTAAPPSRPPQTVAAAQFPSSQVPAAPGKSKRNIIIGVVAALVGLALIVGAMVALSGGGGSSAPESTRRRTTTEPDTTPESTVADTSAQTVEPLSVAELEAKLLTVGEVNAEAGGGFREIEPGPSGAGLCGLEVLPTQASAVRVFNNNDTAASVVSAIDRYRTTQEAQDSWAQEQSVRTSCPERTYEINGVPYTLTVLPFDEALQSSLQERDREVLGLLVGYLKDTTSGRTDTAFTVAADNIFQFIVETVDGPNLIGVSYITVNRQLAADEISAYIRLFQTALRRATS